MNVSEYIFDYLSMFVDTVYFIPGGGCNFLVDALGRSKLKHISMLHEQGAGYAAVGYAMLRGLGVCLTTSGPGATNAVTPCLAAWMDSVPVIFISGQVRTDKLANPGQRFNVVQEANILEIVKPITKDRSMVLVPWAIDKVMKAAVEIARHGRPGPVWLDVPQDIQGAEIGN